MFNGRYNNIIIQKQEAKIKIVSQKHGTHFAIIDIEDVELCETITWHLEYSKTIKSFYVRGNINNKKISLHRLITSCPTGMVVDHINHDTLDNRKENLKTCLTRENNKNNKSNTSGFCGVVWDKSRNKWKAQIKYGNKLLFLGRYKSYDDACNARKSKEIELSI